MKKKLPVFLTLLIAMSIGGPLSAQEITPYLGTPSLISATKTTIIEAENYDIGGEGNAYHDADTTMNATNNPDFRIDEGVDIEPASQGGFNVGWTAAGEWLKYTVNVEATKSYIITARVASPVGQLGSHLSLSFSKNGATTDSLTSILKGSWQDWIWSIPDTLELEAGEQVMTININTGGYNLDFIEIVPVEFVPIAVTGVTLSSPTLDLMGGDTVTLTASVAPEDATRKQFTWKSSNVKVATVASGVVIAVGKGVDTITVTTEDGGFMAECKVTVTTIDVTGVSLSENKLNLKVTQKDTLKVTISPADAFIKTITWKSSDTKIATVTSAGIVTGKALGVATITVTTKDGGFTAVCEVTVSPPTGISSNSASRVMVYPNPSTDGFISIRINGQTENALVNIYSIIGESVYSELLNLGETTQLNNRLKPGLYLIKISGKGLNEVRKLQVN